MILMKASINTTVNRKEALTGEKTRVKNSLERSKRTKFWKLYSVATTIQYTCFNKYLIKQRLC